jgi:hypothetical protein
MLSRMKVLNMTKRILTVGFIGLCTFSVAQAQLAITEVMTSATGNNPDWWELTDFGTNSVNLTGYCWNDDSHGGFSGAPNTSEFTGVIIHPGESIIFTEQKGNIFTASDFRNWWGISPNVQVIACLASDPGLGAGGDTVRLWSTNSAAMGAATNGMDIDQAPNFLVDRVDTTVATTGFSILANTNNGTFGINSAIGVNGAFAAATTTDVGSPGIALTNAGPIVITNINGTSGQPASVLANIGTTATFQITAFGYPKPRFQWLFNGVPVDTNLIQTEQTVFTITNNFSRSTLMITNVQITNAGTFRVVVTNIFQNGTQSVVSSNAVLTVSTSPLAPIFTQTPSPQNFYAYLGQTVKLNAAAFGNPPPTFQWQHNNVNIDGQTDSQLSLGLSDTNQSGTYSVIANNSAGSTNASILLTVTPLPPKLRITEILATEATNSAGSSLGHNDWWELTDLDTYPVNLQGFRFDDDSFSLLQAVTLTNNIVISPGESIVLVEDMTPDDFRSWWGATNLPPNLQIITYHGSGVSFSGTSGDQLTLWNAAAQTESDLIDSVSIASTDGSAISYCYDPYGNFIFGINPDSLSILGVNGAFAAAVNGDIGSPGTIVNYPKFTGIAPASGGMQLSWISQSNFVYSVQCKTNLTDASWTTLANTTAGGNLWNFIDTTTVTQRFYRVVLNFPTTEK